MKRNILLAIVVVASFWSVASAQSMTDKTVAPQKELNDTVGVQKSLFTGAFIPKMAENATRSINNNSEHADLSKTKSAKTNGKPQVYSPIGSDIYVGEKVYFDPFCWTFVGAGNNFDPTISNPDPNHKLRFGSTGGISFWGTNGALDNNDPTFNINSNYILSNTKILTNIKTKDGNSINLIVGTSSPDEKDGWIGTYSNHGLHVGANNSSALYLGTDNNIYMGLADSEVDKIRKELKDRYRLFVSKGILSEDYTLAPKASWADFVFYKNYDLPTISEVEDFISENNHLPNVPSAKQIAEEGYSQHDMNKILLQKIEELTLYTIQQQKTMEQQQKEIVSLKTELDEIKK